MDLDALVQLHARRCNDANGYATSTHSGVAAVLQAVATETRAQARALQGMSQATAGARQALLRLAQSLEHEAHPAASKRLTRAVN